MTKFCTWVDIQGIIITYAAFGDDRLRGLAVARGRISHFPTDLSRRPYNTPSYIHTYIQLQFDSAALTEVKSTSDRRVHAPVSVGVIMQTVQQKNITQILTSKRCQRH